MVDLGTVFISQVSVHILDLPLQFLHKCIPTLPILHFFYHVIAPNLYHKPLSYHIFASSLSVHKSSYNEIVSPTQTPWFI
jgi:hypothetical protein